MKICTLSLWVLPSRLLCCRHLKTCHLPMGFPYILMRSSRVLCSAELMRQRAVSTKTLRTLLRWHFARVLTSHTAKMSAAFTVRMNEALALMGAESCWLSWRRLSRRRRDLLFFVSVVARFRARSLSARVWSSWGLLVRGGALSHDVEPSKHVGQHSINQLSPSFKQIKHRPASPRESALTGEGGQAALIGGGQSKIERVTRYTYSKPLDQWLTSELQVLFGNKPFACGQHRACYMVWEVDGRGAVGDQVLVAKLPRSRPLSQESHDQSSLENRPSSAAAPSNRHKSSTSTATPHPPSATPSAKHRPPTHPHSSSATPAQRKIQRLALKAEELQPYFAEYFESSPHSAHLHPHEAASAFPAPASGRAPRVDLTVLPSATEPSLFTKALIQVCAHVQCMQTRAESSPPLCVMSMLQIQRKHFDDLSLMVSRIVKTTDFGRRVCRGIQFVYSKRELARLRAHGSPSSHGSQRSALLCGSGVGGQRSDRNQGWHE